MQNLWYSLPDEPSIEDVLKIYPNPASDRLIINLFEPRSASYVVYNGLSVTVLQGQLQNGNASLDISILSQGLYIFQLVGIRGALRFLVVE